MGSGDKGCTNTKGGDETVYVTHPATGPVPSPNEESPDKDRVVEMSKDDDNMLYISCRMCWDARDNETLVVPCACRGGLAVPLKVGPGVNNGEEMSKWGCKYDTLLLILEINKPKVWSMRVRGESETPGKASKGVETTHRPAGTQKYVHASCLRRWQQAVLSSRSGDVWILTWCALLLPERAYRCAVCKAMYTLSPIVQGWKLCRWQVLRGFAAFLCLLFVFYGVIEPPWPHLAIFAIILLGSRSQGVLAIILLLTGMLLAALHLRGLSMFMQLHDTIKGTELPIRSTPMHGIHAGLILVASENIHGSIFSQSIVLIYQHNRSGSRGVILNQQMTADPDHENGCVTSSLNSDCGTTVPNTFDKMPMHFFGGPVGLPGEGARQEILALHGFGSISGSKEIHFKCPDTKRIYYGGKLADVLEEANQATEESPVMIFHGISTWGPGQLEGEIISGAWGYRIASCNDIFVSLSKEQSEEVWSSNYRRVKWLV